jgi:hypothetical protein
VKRLALAGIFASTLLIAAAYAAALLPGETPSYSAWLIALGAPGALVSAMALGAARRGDIGWLIGASLLALFVILAGGFSLLLLITPADARQPHLLAGLPLPAAILIYGIGLLPLFIVPVAYALTFDAHTLSDEDIARLRDAAPTA